MQVNLSNPYQNLALNHAFQSSILSAKEKQNQEVDENQQTQILASNFDTQSYKSEFNFRINSQGFFEKDLNKIANIPQDYDINIKSMRLIAKELIKQDENLNYNQIDLPFLLNSYHNALSSLNTEFNSQDYANLKRTDLQKMIQGFSTQNGEFMGKFERIYQNSEDLNQALSQQTSLNTHMLDNKIVNFHFDKILNNSSQNEILKPYLNRDSSVKKGGALMNFIYHDIKAQNEQEFNFFMKPVSLDTKAHQNLYSLLKGEMEFDDLIKQNNEEKMSFDLYLYVNGVDKNNTSQDKLSVFFQQYINYEKSMDIKEFANSSSIFELYMDKTKQEFMSLRKSFQNQSVDKEQLDEMSLRREDNHQNFLDRRQQQAHLNKVLKSYFSVML